MGYSKEKLRNVYEGMRAQLVNIDQFIQSVTARAYRNPRLIANDVLSRNPHAGNLFHNVMFDECPQHIGVTGVLWRLLRYYARNMAMFLLWVVNYATYRFFIVHSNPPLHFDEGCDHYILDVFVLVDNVLQEGQYRERYFPGLQDILEKRGACVTMLPKFNGILTPSRLFKLNRVLRQSNYRFITEFDLLRWVDVWRYLKLLVLYPFDVIRLALRYRKDGDFMPKLLGEELLNTLDAVVSHTFVRYLVGVRLVDIDISSSTYLVNWFENQAIDKAMFYGMREKQSAIYVFGVQSFIGCPPYLCHRVAESDRPFGMVPDVVMANATLYMHHSSSISQRMGVSFRNRELFHQSIVLEAKQKAFIFLPLQPQQCEDVIGLSVLAPTIRNQQVLVTSHPANVPDYLPKLPVGWEHTSRDRFDLLSEAAVIISTDSSTAVEAAALGTSVIIVASQNSYTCNPMEKEGRGELWDIAFDGKDMELLYRRLLDYRLEHPERIRRIAEYYRNQCFVEPTEANIVNSFDLKQ